MTKQIDHAALVAFLQDLETWDMSLATENEALRFLETQRADFVSRIKDMLADDQETTTSTSEASEPRKIKFFAQAGDITNPAKHTFVVEVPGNMTDAFLQEEAEQFMWEHVAPEFGFEEAGEEDEVEDVWQ